MDPRARQQAARRILEQGGELQVTLPVPPKILHPNARGHWAGAMKEKKRHRQQAGDTAAAQVLERYGTRPRFERAIVGLHYVLQAPQRGGNQPHDPDNLIAWAKASIDALTDAGILADDRQIVYLPPSQEWLPAGAIDPPRLQVTVCHWSDQRCPFCQTPG